MYTPVSETANQAQIKCVIYAQQCVVLSGNVYFFNLLFQFIGRSS